MSNCKKCKINHKCQNPWESDKSTQMQYLGRTYTEEEWENEGECKYFDESESVVT